MNDNMLAWLKKHKVVQHGIMLGIATFVAFVLYAEAYRYVTNSAGWTDKPIEQLIQETYE